jgi:cobalt-zinc-cadmium efflux system protein
LEEWRSPHRSEAEKSLKTKRRALGIAIVLSVLAFSIQILGSIYTGSLALVGDTVHVFTDLMSLVMSLVAVVLSTRPLNSMRSFGLFRLEVLASFVNGLLLVLVATKIAWEALERFQNPYAVPAIPLLAVAVVGLAFNLLSALALYRSIRSDAHHEHHHGHNHGHDHHHHHHGDRNLRSAMLHVMSDALGSVAVIIGALTIHYTGMLWVDPAIGLLLAIVIFGWSIRVVGEAGHVLLEGTPKHINMADLERTLTSCDSRVARFDDLHVWEITSRMYALSVELYVQEMPLGDADKVRSALEEKLHEKFGIAHTAVVIKRVSS